MIQSCEQLIEFEELTPAVIPEVAPNAAFAKFERRGAPHSVAAGLAEALERAAAGWEWTVERQGDFAFSVTAGAADVRIMLQAGTHSSTSVYPIVAPPLPSTEIALIGGNDQVASVVRDYCEILTDEEVEAVVRSMPLVEAVSSRQTYPALHDFAVIFRDHFLEDNLALLLAFERAGVEPHWMYALAKGDLSPQRDRMRRYLRRRGYRADTFDNAWFDYDDRRRGAMAVELESFIAEARRAGKRVVMVDDGALLANCWPDRQQLLDCAVEVTIVGIRRLEALPRLDIPVFDVAQSQVKMFITYPEIAEACVRRICELLGGEKIRGRNTLVAGYGTAGREIARRLRDKGCVVTVVDHDVIKLIESVENGFRSFRSLHAALRATQPFLVIGCTGDLVFDREAFALLPEGGYITGIATRDLDCLTAGGVSERVVLPHVGSMHTFQGRTFIQLGDGRSVNLFESESIPNTANDVFKAAIFLSTAHLCANVRSTEPGLHIEPVNEVIRRAGLLDAYYDRYLRDACDIVKDHGR